MRFVLVEAPPAEDGRAPLLIGCRKTIRLLCGPASTSTLILRCADYGRCHESLVCAPPSGAVFHWQPPYLCYPTLACCRAVVRFAVSLSPTRIPSNLRCFHDCPASLLLSGAYCFSIGFRPTLVAYERPSRSVAINIGMFVQERNQARSLTLTICCAICSRQPVSRDREVEEVAMCQDECDTAHFSLQWLYRRAFAFVRMRQRESSYSQARILGELDIPRVLCYSEV